VNLQHSLMRLPSLEDNFPRLSPASSGRMELARVLEGTSAANMASALGMKEADLAVDWNEYLSRAEMDKIRGARDD